MKKSEGDTLSLWRKEGSLLIYQNFEEFRRLVAQTKVFVRSGQYEAAAIYAELAASYAVSKHCGLFVSPELESIISEIGWKVIPTNLNVGQIPTLQKTPKHILHIATLVNSIGGHSKMICRWVQQDSKRCHSLVLTRQGTFNIPNILNKAISNSSGKIHVLDENLGDFSLIAQAKRLREIATTADLVVLHIHMYDVVPLIAFANKDQSPPILFLDHADHIFWLGASVSDAVISLRKSGQHLAQERRGISPEKSELLPIIVDPPQRVFSRREAKMKIGIPEDSVLLLSIARAIKYETIDGISFADAHVSLLKRFERAFLIVVGSGFRTDWLNAIDQTDRRIIVYPESEDTAIFYQAADLYVDSFPFTSNTSLLEAGTYGVPLISRFPYSNLSSILGADMPGLTGNLIRTRDLEEYRKILSHLIEDDEFRLSLGEATCKKIVEIHTDGFWQKYLEQLYARATVMQIGETGTTAAIDRMFIGEPDVFINYIHGGTNYDFDSSLAAHPLRQKLPITHRLWLWLSQVKKYGFGQRGRISILLPNWVHLRLKPNR
jgi:glycosyltransferase involved in cell wall biosynthesis